MDIQSILKKDLATAGSNKRFHELIEKTAAGGLAIIKQMYGNADITGTVSILVEAEVALQQIMLLFDEVVPEPTENERPDVSMVQCAVEIIKYMRGSSTAKAAIQAIVNAAESMQLAREAFPQHLWIAARIKLINDIERQIAQEDGYELTSAPAAKIS